MMNMPDGHSLPPDLYNLVNARERYVQALEGLSTRDGLDLKLRHELEQAIARIDDKLARAQEHGQEHGRTAIDAG